jgi:hypothetical protein
MAYMIYQQYTTAIKEAYAHHPDVAKHAAAARTCRQWLASLEIKPELRGVLVEQIMALEEAFQDLLRENILSPPPSQRSGDCDGGRQDRPSAAANHQHRA